MTLYVCLTISWGFVIYAIGSKTAGVLCSQPRTINISGTCLTIGLPLLSQTWAARPFLSFLRRLCLGQAPRALCVLPFAETVLLCLHLQALQRSPSNPQERSRDNPSRVPGT